MYFISDENSNSPIVCNVPHSGTLIPEDYKKDYVVSQDELDKEILYMADNYTDELYRELLLISSYIKSKLSRVVLDIERFKNEHDEPMSQVGMAALYTKTSSGAELRNISTKSKEDLENAYDEYHNTFS